MTSKGQVTIPKDIRRRMGLRPGDRVEFVEEDGHYRLKKVFDPSVLDKWVGYLKHLEGRSSDELVEEMRGPPLDRDE